jgi:hypothetical protein
VAVAAVLAGAVHQPLDLALGQIAAFANCQLLQWLAARRRVPVSSGEVPC